MLKRLRLFRMNVTALLTVGAVALFGLTSFEARAESSDLAQLKAEGYESYLSRPDFLSVKPKAHPNFGPSWEALKRGHLEATALFLEMYPDREIYFLARDAELLYDFAKYVARDDPKLSKRIHLLNISRANMNAPNVLDYLSQEGISEETLKAGKQVLFVDTGFAGTIPRVISEKFSVFHRHQLRTHLMVSSNPNHPSTRVFLMPINPAVGKGFDTSSLHGTIVSYEHLPRYTDRSHAFKKVDGKWAPVSSQTGFENDGAVSKSQALAYMEDLKAYAEDSTTQKLLAERRAQWKVLREISGDKMKLTAALKQLQERGGFEEAMVRDFLEIKETTGIPKSGKPLVTAQSLGIELNKGTYSKKHQLAEEHPEWKEILQDPETGILKALKNEDYSKLGAITDVLDDAEFRDLLCEGLGKVPPTKKLIDFAKMLADKEPAYARTVAANAINKNNVKEMRDLLKYLILDLQDDSVFSVLIRHIFSEPFSEPVADLFVELMGKLVNQNSHLTVKDAFLVLDKPHLDDVRGRAILAYLDGVRFQMKPLNEGTFVRLQLKKVPPSEVAPILRRCLELEDTTHLNVGSYVPQWNSKEFDVYREALLLKKGERAAFFEKRLGPYTGVSPVKEEPALQTQSSSKVEKANSPTPQETAPKPVPIEPISPELSVGAKIKTAKGRDLEVVAIVDQGKRGRVFRVKDKAGKSFALKVAIDSLPETLGSFAEEPNKGEIYKKLDVAHAKIIEAQPSYLLKEWIEGTRADAWIENWVAEGAPKDTPQIKKLREMLQTSAKKGTYIGDLNRKNLIWDGKRWVIVDSGGIKEGLSVQEALDSYLEKVPVRLSKKAGAPAQCSQAMQALYEFLAPAH